MPTRISFTGGFFLCGARIVIAAPADGVVDGVYIAGNEFIGSYCHFSGYGAVETNGTFTSVSDVTVVGTLAEAEIAVRGPQATLTQHAAATPAKSFIFDFTDKLLFNVTEAPILSISASLVLDVPGQAPVAVAARRAVGGVVTVDLAEAVLGSVTVVVDQSHRRGM